MSQLSINPHTRNKKRRSTEEAEPAERAGSVLREQLYTSGGKATVH